MQSGEAKLIQWLTGQAPTTPAVQLGIGDDMAIVTIGDRTVCMTSDMLLDGVHFDTKMHDLSAVGRKALACSLSDCAAMAVKPCAATVSLAVPNGWRQSDAEALYGGLFAIGEEFECAIVGGDTTAWDHPLAIDVAMFAEPYPGIVPVPRSGARSGDVLLITGHLGGSRSGHHMTFTPRVFEARQIADAWGDAVHAMMDISDGLSLDLHRMCQASGVGAFLDERMLMAVASDAAHEASERDGRAVLEHVLSDGEDFELLLAVSAQRPADAVDGVELTPVGNVVDSGLAMRTADGSVKEVTPKGFEHLA